MAAQAPTNQALRIFVVTRTFDGGTTTIAIPTPQRGPSPMFTNPDTPGVYAPSLPEASTLLLSLGENAFVGPRWRVYCSPTGHDDTQSQSLCAPPALPTGFTAADLQLERLAQEIGIFIRMRPGTGSPWTQRGLNRPSANIEWQIAGRYYNVEMF